MTAGPRDAPEFVRILQEVSTAECERDVENILWSHRSYIDAMPSQMREGFYEAVADAWSKRDRELMA
jgi:hypothetical protein